MTRPSRPGPVVWAALAYAAAIALWEGSGWGTPAVRSVVSNLAFVPLNAALAVTAGLAAARDVLHPGVRRALWLLAAGSVCVLVGNAISAGVAVAGDAPVVSPADIFFLADTALLVAALFSFPTGRRTAAEGVKGLLDAAMVLTGGSAAIWYLAARHAAGADADPLARAVENAHELGGLLILLGISRVLLRRLSDPNRVAFRLLAAGLAIAVVADLAFGLVVIEAGERVAAWTDAIYLVAYGLLIASADRYRRRPEPAAADDQGDAPRWHPISPLPYVAVAGLYVLLLHAASTPWTSPLSPLVAGAVVATVLVVARQFIAVRENVRLLAEAAAQENEARFCSLGQHASDVVLVAAADGRIRFVGPSADRVLRVRRDSLLHRHVTELVHPDDQAFAEAFLAAAAAPGVTAPVELRLAQPDDCWLHAEVIATNLLDDPTVRGIVLNARDVSERKRLEEQLTHRTFHDPLTGLANRALFRDRVGHALTLAVRHQRQVSVLLLDLDDFKRVNDSLGHGEGDRLLSAAAERLRSCARASDTVARLGSDEFAILSEEAETADGPLRMAERLITVMAQPFTLGTREVRVTTSVGIATSLGAESADELLRNADVAMYAAKRRGGSGWSEYRSHMVADLRERLELEEALRAAVERQEFSLHYQPIVCLRTGAIRGVEALVRWQHPRHGHMLPGRFIPLAEETGLIVPLGAWVLRTACRQLQQWREAFPELDLTMAVNVSSRQLQDRDLIHATRDVLAETGVDPAAVVLEITESLLMQHTGAAFERLHELKALGVRLAIDDFGTGYSSLSYLRRFPIDILKVAKPFVDDLGSDTDQPALARAIVGLAQTLRLRTVGEGIEREAQAAALADLGCHQGQGYLFSPPVPAEALERMLAGGQATPSLPAGAQRRAGRRQLRAAGGA